MAPKNKFSREEIIEVAFNIAKNEGFEGITIRKVAKEVGCSIAPIYVNFKDIDELKEAVVNRIKELIQSIIDQQNTGEPFLDIGVASIKFAQEYSVIYKEYILQGNRYLSKEKDTFNEILINKMKNDNELKDFNDEELKLILMKMKIFQVGLSLLATDNSFMNDLTDKKILELLKDSGSDAILGLKYRKNNINSEEK